MTLGFCGGMVLFGIAMAGDEAATLLGLQEQMEPSWVTAGMGGGLLAALGVGAFVYTWMRVYRNIDKLVEEHNSKVVPEKEKGEVIHVSMK